MRVKIHGGTARSGEPSLCTSCRYATVVKGPGLRDEIVECGQLADGHGRITFHVTSCNKYVQRGHPAIYEMEEIAWVLRSDPRRSEIGFVPARKLRAKDRVFFEED